MTDRVLSLLCATASGREGLLFHCQGRLKPPGWFRQEEPTALHVRHIQPYLPVQSGSSEASVLARFVLSGTITQSCKTGDVNSSSARLVGRAAAATRCAVFSIQSRAPADCPDLRKCHVCAHTLRQVRRVPHRHLVRAHSSIGMCA